MLESQDRIVTEDVAPLFDQATGLDTPPASGTVTTTIEESRSVITAIIRKAWTATLTMLGGASVISYIAAAYTYLRNRLQGNETYGIPDRRSEFSASSPLAANLALLNDRKIGGVPEAEDGISLVHLISSSAAYNTITEIDDDNHGWVLDKAIGNIAPNCERATIRCKEISAVNGLRSFKAKKLNLAECETITSGTTQYNDPLPADSEEIDLPVLKTSHCIFFVNYGTRIAKLPEVEALSGRCFYSDSNTDGVMRELRVPKLKTFDTWSFLYNYSAQKCNQPYLILLEIGSNVSCNISNWNPTEALRTDTNSLVVDEWTIKPEGVDVSNWKNLDLFLYNFKTFIALRLKGGYSIGQGPILTLSQAVRNAIHAAEATYGIENIIITQKGWTISPAPN